MQAIKRADANATMRNSYEAVYVFYECIYTASVFKF